MDDIYLYKHDICNELKVKQLSLILGKRKFKSLNPSRRTWLGVYNFIVFVERRFYVSSYF